MNRRTAIILALLLLAVPVMLGCALLDRMTAFFAADASPPLVGDPVRGERLFRVGVEGASPCLVCHVTSEGGAGFSLGPNLAGVGERAAGRVPGLSAEAYLTQSILAPESYVVPGFRVSMFDEYPAYLTPQDVADLVAYLLTL